MMDVIENFHFIRPWCLLALAPALLIFIALLHQQRRNTDWTRLIAPHLLPWLLENKQSTASKAPLLALLLLWSIASLALAGPTWEKIQQPLMKDSSALVVLFDLSPSMNVEDLPPSRLVRARLKLIDLLDSRDEGLTALVAYAGEAHVVTPLTDDVDTIKNLIPSLSPHTMPVAGSNPEMAFEQAHTLLRDAGIEHGNIVFLSDGIHPSAFPVLKKQQREHSHKVSIWGFGTAEGAPIQLTDGGFARNKKGEIVVAKLDHDELSEAAIAMNGMYIPHTDSSDDIQTIHTYSLDPMNAQQRKVERDFDQWSELGPWLVLFCLPIAALSFRRGLLLCPLFLLFLLPAGELKANENRGVWESLWQTRDQQAQALLDQGQIEQAADFFETPERKAQAWFKAQKFEDAAKHFSESENSARNHYNEGTALTHAGKYDDAIAAFERALTIRPDFADANNNKSIAEKLKALEEQNQDQQQSDQQQSNQQQGDQSQNEQSQDSQEQDGQNQDKQNSDNQNQEQQQQNGEAGENQQNEQQSSEQASNESTSSQQKQDEGEQQDADAPQKHNAQEQDEALQEYQDKIAQAEEQQDTEASQPEQDATQVRQLSPEELAQSEDEQALEQWLRRVPDDPGRLLRNKFRHETQQRQLELNTNTWNTPENSTEERW